MTFKISDHLLEAIDTDTIIYTNKVKFSKEYLLRQTYNKVKMNSLYGRPKQYADKELNPSK